MTSNTNHLISPAAFQKGSNVFIWTPRGGYERIIFNWRIDEDQPMTHGTVYRWIDLVIDEEEEKQVPDHNYSIFPVKISCDALTPLAHIIEHTDPRSKPLTRNGTDFLEPGDYAIYLPDGSKSHLPYHYRPQISYFDHTAMMKAYPKYSMLIDPPSEGVKKRDKDVCSLTGAVLPKEKLGATWIMPPNMFFAMPKHKEDRRSVSDAFNNKPETRQSFMDPMLTLRNCLQMSSDLVKLFQENQITIDVDDNYRIFYFCKREPPQNSIREQPQTRLVLSSHLEYATEFLRGHFLHSLRVHIVGGDIADEFSSEDARRFMDDSEMGVDDGVENYPAEHWKSELGLQVTTWLSKIKPLDGEPVLGKS